MLTLARGKLAKRWPINQAIFWLKRIVTRQAARGQRVDLGSQAVVPVPQAVVPVPQVAGLALLVGVQVEALLEEQAVPVAA